MSDAYGDGYGSGMPTNRDQIVQALMNVQNPPPGGATQAGMPAGLPTPGGAGVPAGAGSTPMPYAAPPGAVGNPNVAPPPAGIGGRGFAPPIPANPAAGLANQGLGQQYNNQIPAGAAYQGLAGLANQGLGQQLPGAPGNLVPNLGAQLPPGGLPRY